jgi:hypothetical protein
LVAGKTIINMAMDELYFSVTPCFTRKEIGQATSSGH